MEELLNELSRLRGLQNEGKKVERLIEAIEKQIAEMVSKKPNEKNKKGR